MFARISAIIVVGCVLGSHALAAHSGFPVAITTGPLPQPVLVNGMNHLVYELHLTNVAPIPIELLTLDVFGDDESKPLASYRDKSLEELLVPAENLLTFAKVDDGAKARTIAEGRSAVIFLDLALDAKVQPPNKLHHRFLFDIRGNPDLERTVKWSDHPCGARSAAGSPPANSRVRLDRF